MSSSIQIKHFCISALGDQAAEDELNRFLRSHHVLSVRQEFVAGPPDSVWYIAVRYALNETDSTHSKPTARRSIDYKDVLEPEAFARFVELRERRKAIAEAENLPAFAVFTDKELAAIAELEAPKPNELGSLKGIGAKRVERFAERILSGGAIQDENDEASGKSV